MEKAIADLNMVRGEIITNNPIKILANIILNPKGVKEKNHSMNITYIFAFFKG